MPSSTDLLLKNLEDALNQAQRYVISGCASAALFVVLVNDAPRLLESGGTMEVPTLGPIDPRLAALVLMIAYIVFPLLAASALDHLKGLVADIKDQSLVEAALKRLSIATTTNSFLRRGAVLLPPVLLFSGYVVEQLRGATPVTVWAGVGYLMFSLPYLCLLKKLWIPVKPE